MAKQSAGILVYRKDNGIEVFLVHPGGPFFAKKDAGAWSVPKGEFGQDEDPLHAAKREFKEETGHKIDGNFIPLLPIKQKGGKVVHVWAVEGEVDADAIISNTFQLAWPPRSGKIQEFPEVDKAAWLNLEVAREKINAGQISLLDQLNDLIA
ncbi:NUDIX domain-containing protein [Dyadobacter sp. CY345]|uniref:NUDIX domain-containing protein n=1 Tax=Dyadobacter sp. CY345 TaxID=2909335 RepID=UPI001F2C1286|nr:NUDIX domain-containing protein [Dyadobacter sp. CY345]MCF2447267.1 NUDIX domain-containing protein [Dyadobacter sp. CY345]